MFSTPRRECGNVIVELDVEDYQRGIEDLKINVVAKLTIQRGKAMPTTLELKDKLVHSLDLSTFKLIPYGGGLYHALLHTIEDRAKIISKGPIQTHPGIDSSHYGVHSLALKTTVR